MNRVRPWLWIGRYRDTINNAPGLAAAGITAALLLAADVELPGIDTLYLAVDDGAPLPAGALARGLEFVRAARSRGDALLIACGAGMSRSVVFATLALHELEGLELAAALRDIKSHHPPAMPHPTLWRSLCDHVGAPFRRGDLR